MFKNNLKIAWRNLIKTRMYSIINGIGLAIGMAVALLIGFWVKDEISFNHSHKNYRQLAAIMSTVTLNGRSATYMAAPAPLAEELRNRYPEDFKRVALVSEQEDHAFAAGNNRISSNGIWAQPEFPLMFTFHLIAGSETALKDPGSLLISRSFARSLFGDKNAVNKPVKMDGHFDLKVGGVYEDLPGNSSFEGIAFLLPWANESNARKDGTGWSSLHFQVFVQLTEQADAEKISDKIKDICKPHIRGGQYESVLLHPMDRWHLYDEYSNGKMAGGQIQKVRLFGLTGLFVLLIACINFMNLSTARSEKRAKEVGIRKTMGSSRQQLIVQFLSESVMITFLSLLLALILLLLFLPLFNSLTDKELFIPWTMPLFWVFVIGFTFFTGLISGSYPAFYLSHFEPTRVLKGNMFAGRLASVPRKILVVVQFTVSISLIIGTIIVFRQIQFGKKRQYGYNQSGLISMGVSTPGIKDHYMALRNDLLQSGAVSEVAESSSRLTNLENELFGYDWRGRDPHTIPVIGTVGVSHDFGKTVGWKIIAGRDFSRSFPADTGALIINEAAAKYLGFKDPVGEIISWHSEDHRIVGVVNNIIMESPYAPVQPVFFRLDYEWVNNMYMHLNPSVAVPEAFSRIAAVLKKYDLENPFEYRFTAETYAAKFYQEEHTENLALIFATLAIFISCLGLFGLAAFVAEQRTKEIGIRKVLGATVMDVWTLLSKDFVGLVAVSCLIAAPLAWYFLSQWLQQYEYRTELSWWVFAMAGAGALLITLLTVSFQAIQAAWLNPVNSLRSE